MDERGFSLTELIIAIAIMGILMAIATHNWQEMQRKAGVENQIRKIHADLMEVRLQALHRKTPRSLVISGKQLKIYGTTDTSVAPMETRVFQYDMIGKDGDTDNDYELTFDAQGLTNDQGSLCVVPTGSLAVLNEAGVDSIVISQARINLGKRTATGDCKSDNIDQK